MVNMSASLKASGMPSTGENAEYIREKMKKLVCDATRSCNQRRIHSIAHNVANASVSDMHLLGDEDEENDERLRDHAEAALNALDFVSDGPLKKVVMPFVAPPPRGVLWSRLRTNLKAPKEYEEEFFVPYLGDRDEDQTSSWKLASDLMSAPTIESPETSSEAQMKQKVLDVVKKSPLMLHQTHAVKNQGDDSDAEDELLGRSTPNLDDFVDGMWGRARKRVAIRNVAKAFSSALWSKLVPILAQMLGISSVSVYRYLSNAMYRENKWLVKDFETKAGKNHERQIVAQVRKTPKLPNRVILNSNSVKYFLCRQCYTYDCQMHGDDTAKPRIFPYDMTRKENCPKEIQSKLVASCPWKRANKCYFVNQFNGQRASSTLEKNHEFCVLVREFRDHFGDDFCRITSAVNGIETAFLNVSCEEVGYYVLNHGGKPSETGEELDLKKKRNRKFMALENLSGHKRPDYEACNHEGPCTKENNCICCEKGLACEKSCGCNLGRVCGDRVQGKSDMWCNRAFAGCNCSAAASCKSKTCDCFAMNRECDPDLCRSCMHCEVNSAGKMARKCHNSSLRLKEHHRVVVGRSRVHGWGVYSTAAIPKGDLIGEYVGEVIVHDHAERRGRVYDKVNYSFLFDTTVDVSVDSTRMGNKLRYCNHSFEPNCKPRLNRVSGDVRVGLYATRDIVPFEELFFNYNYDKNGPAWAQKGKRSKKNSKRVPPKSAPQASASTSGPGTSSEGGSMDDVASLNSDGDGIGSPDEMPDVNVHLNMTFTGNRNPLGAQNANSTRNENHRESPNGRALAGVRTASAGNVIDMNGVSEHVEMANGGRDRGAAGRSGQQKRMRLLNGLGQPVGRTEGSPECAEFGVAGVGGDSGNVPAASPNRTSLPIVVNLDSDSDDFESP